MQQLYWGENSKVSYGQHKQTIGKLKSDLERIRADCRSQRLEAQNVVDRYNNNDSGFSSADEEFYRRMKSISISCSEKMCSFAGSIISESLNTLVESVPCEFQAVAIGSLPKGEATPYSDLEYLFLIANSTKETVRYFEKLALTSYFIIGNLGETKLSYMAIDELKGWFDDQALNGFKIDGLADSAGNIPTGNGGEGQHNHFIVTPQDLADRYLMVLNNPQKEALRGDLTAMLTYTSAFYSSQEKGRDLIQKFRKLIEVEVPNELRKKMNLEMLQSDVRKFNFVPNDDLVHKGFNVNVKKELYRYPSIFLMDVSILLGAAARTSWDSLEKLINSKRLSPDLGDSLSFCLAAAVYIRLSAYLHHDSHDDRMSVAEQFGPTTKVAATEHRRWFIPSILFSRLWEKLFPLKYSLSARDNKFEPKDLQNLSFTTTAAWSKVIAQFFSGRFQQALASLKHMCGEHLLEDPVTAVLERIKLYNEDLHSVIIYVVSETLCWCSEDRAALELYSYTHNEGFKDCRARIALSMMRLGQQEEAIALLLPAVREPYDQRNILSHIEEHSLLADIYEKRGEYAKAEKQLVLAIQLELNIQPDATLTDYHGNPLTPTPKPKPQIDLVRLSPKKRPNKISVLTPNILIHMNGLGEIYLQQERHELAEEYLLRTLSGISDLFGENVAVPVTVSVLHNLGKLYQVSFQFNKSLEFQFKALTISKEISGGRSTRDVSKSLYSIAETHTILQQGEEAREYYQQSIAVMRGMVAESEYKKPEMYKELGNALFTLAHSYDQSNEFQEAEGMYLEALSSYRQTCSDVLSEDIADTLNNLGNLYKDMRLAKKADRTLGQALSRYKTQQNYYKLARALFNLGNNHGSQEQLYKAKEYCRWALAIYRVLSQGQDTTAIAQTYYRIGYFCSEAGETREASVNLSVAKHMLLRIEPTSFILREIDRCFPGHPGPVGQ